MTDQWVSRSFAPAARWDFVGRERELAVLDQAFQAARAGRGSLILISGAPGIGKTALAEEVGRRATAQGALFAIGRCYEHGAAPPFAPWPDLLDDLRGSSPSEFDPLPHPFGAGPAPQSQFELMSSVGRLLGTVGTSNPQVLLLDDLQWADRDGIELLEVATRRIERSSLLVIGTYREGDLPSGHPLDEFLPQLMRNRPARALHLGALALDEATLLIQRLTGDSSPDLCAYVHGRSGGNPFFLTEMVKDLIEQGSLNRDPEGQAMPPASGQEIPSLLRQVIRQRLEHLGPDVRALLEAAAVAGTEWGLEVVDGILGWKEDLLQEALESALRSQVIEVSDESTERFRYTHGLIWEVLYSEIPLRQRRQMHSAVADVFIDAVPSVSNPIAAAYHLASAGRWAEAAPRYLAAGDSARGRFATHSALDSYERALDALFHYPDTASNALELNIRERLADVHIVLNHQERALEQLQRVRELARTSGDAEAEGRALTALSYVQTRLYRTGDALQTGREALDVAHVAEDVEILASAYANLAHVHLVVGELEESSVYLHEATRAAGKTANVQGEAWIVFQKAELSMFRGDYPQAAHLAQEALKLAEASGDSLRVGGALWVQGWALGELGRYRQAKEALESGLRRLRESGESHYLGRLLNTLGWLHSEFGDLESALAWDLQALETATGGKGGPLAEVERYSLLNLATDELLLGNIEEAEAYLTRVGKLMNEVEYSRFRYLNRYHLVKAELALVKRDAAETLRSVAEAYDLATAKGARKNICKSLLLRGRALLALGQTPEAIVSIQQAKAVADELLHGSLRWQCTLTLAQAYRLAGHVDEAASLIEAGASLLDQAVAALPAGHSREAFLQSPTARALLAGSRDGEEQRVHRHSPDDLTERQVEVLQYVARGKTNREIAEILVLSERTVQRHVLDIYRKLGVHNRAQATAYVLDGPLRRK